MLSVWIPYDSSLSSRGYYVIGEGVRPKRKTSSRRKRLEAWKLGGCGNWDINIAICRTIIAFHLTASLLHTVYFQSFAYSARLFMSPSGWTTPAQLEYLESKKLSFLAAKESGSGIKKAWLADTCRDFFALWKCHEDELEERRVIAAKKGVTLKMPDTPFFATHADWYKCREAVRNSYFYVCCLHTAY